MRTLCIDQNPLIDSDGPAFSFRTGIWRVRCLPNPGSFEELKWLR